MTLNIQELKNLSVFLGSGKWTLTAKESMVLLTLISKVDLMVKEQENLNTKNDTKEEDTKKGSKNKSA
jgi:hypothetical protein